MEELTSLRAGDLTLIDGTLVERSALQGTLLRWASIQVDSLRITLLSIAALAVPIALTALPRGATVAVVGHPFTDVATLQQVIIDAGGSFVREHLSAGVLVARSDDPRFVARLYDAGAFLVLNPVEFTGCL